MIEWKYYSGEPLELNDLVYCDKGGLAFIDSGLTTKEPDRISSMPEGWSYEPVTLSIADGILTQNNGEVFDKIIKFARINESWKS